MAELIPRRSQCLRSMTAGEKRFSERLEAKLEDDYLCWYDIPVGPKGLRPDFVILNPRRGILVLEVKDWKLDSIQSMDRGQAKIFANGGLVTQKNPLMQARAYVLEIVNLLQKDPALVSGPNERHSGKLALPWGHGAVLTRITRKQFESTNLGEVMAPSMVICQDEMTDAADAEDFQQRLWQMFKQPFHCLLSLPQLDRIRWHLYPEVRVQAPTDLFAEDNETHIPDIVRVMDLQQEQLARSLGEGHRIIHGCAGTGKTMILGYRCERLAQLTAKPILVLCYNKTLAGRLAQVMASKGLAPKVVVRHFHGWCSEILKAYHVAKPVTGPPVDEYLQQMVRRTIEATDSGQIPRGQYGAVLIDEGHDFEPDWFDLVVRMIDPATNSLLVLYDDAQAIYRKNRSLKFSFASVGIQAQGRTTVLRLNYRNTEEVLGVASLFAKELLGEKTADDDRIPVVAPESAGRRGPCPELIKCKSAWAEADCLVSRIAEEQAHGRVLSDVAVLYRHKWQAQSLEKALSEAGIPFRSTLDNRAKLQLYRDEDSVKLVSMPSSKGLEFGFVAIPGVDTMPARSASDEQDARLLYVAMTRAMDKLVMLHRKDTAFTQRLRNSITTVEQQSRAA